MSCECPNQQQMCDPVRGLPYNPSGIPFIDEEDDPAALHAVVVCNDLRSPPEAQGLIPNDDTPPPRRPRRQDKARRHHRGPLKANDVRVSVGAGGGGGGPAGGADRRGSLRRGLRGLANKVRPRNSSGAGASSDGRQAATCCGGAKPGCGRTAGLSLLLSGAYCLLAVIAAVVTYSLVAHLVEALRYPLRAVKYQQVDEHRAPALVIYPDGAALTACSSYYHWAVPSTVRLTQLDLANPNCTYVNLTVNDPHHQEEAQDRQQDEGQSFGEDGREDGGQDGGAQSVLVIRGPTAVTRQEVVLVHLTLTDPSRDFLSLTYHILPDWDGFNASSEENRTLTLETSGRQGRAASVGPGVRAWVRLSAKQTHFANAEKHTKITTEQSDVKHWDKRPLHDRNHTHLYFIFFEWKDDLIEETYFLYATTAWHVGACLCAVFLTLHKAYSFLRTSVKKAKRNRRKRKYSSLNNKPSKTEPEEHSCECACAEAADKNQSCDNES